MSTIARIRNLVRNGLYYLTEHAYEEATDDGFDVFDVEQGVMTGRVRKSWLRQHKAEVVGFARDGRIIGIVCRITPTEKVRVITVYEIES